MKKFFYVLSLSFIDFFSIYFLYELEAPAFAITPKTVACAFAAPDIVGGEEDYFVIILVFSDIFALSIAATAPDVAILASAIPYVAVP